MRLPAAVTIAAALAFPASALASPHVRADIDAAQRYWGTQVCAGQWQVIADPTLASRNAYGEATGLGFTHNPEAGAWTDDRGHRWDWHVERCEFTMDPELQGGLRRCVVAHEMGHFIHGPGHTGPMDTAIWHKCIAIADALEAQQATATPKRRVRQRRLRHRHIRSRQPASKAPNVRR